ncbi:hypothetical protein D3C85_1672950 [compost metagenome]
MIDAGQTLSLPGVIDQQCVALRPYVPTLIDGFALSPELLRAPIAQDDYIQAFCKQVNTNVDWCLQRARCASSHPGETHVRARLSMPRPLV